MLTALEPQLATALKKFFSPSFKCFEKQDM